MWSIYFSHVTPCPSHLLHSLYFPCSSSWRIFIFSVYDRMSLKYEYAVHQGLTIPRHVCITCILFSQGESPAISRTLAIGNCPSYSFKLPKSGQINPDSSGRWRMEWWRVQQGMINLWFSGHVMVFQEHHLVFISPFLWISGWTYLNNIE